MPCYLCMDKHAITLHPVIHTTCLQHENGKLLACGPPRYVVVTSTYNILQEKLVEKLSAYYRNPIHCCHWKLSWARWSKFAYSHSPSISILILSSDLRLGPKSSLPFRFSDYHSARYSFLSHTCHTQPIFLQRIPLILPGSTVPYFMAPAIHRRVHSSQLVDSNLKP
jgi:hypothetical protein